MSKLPTAVTALLMIALVALVAWSAWYDVQCDSDSNCVMSLRKADYQCTESHYQLAGKVLIYVCDNYRRVE